MAIPLEIACVRAPALTPSAVTPLAFKVVPTDCPAATACATESLVACIAVAAEVSAVAVALPLSPAIPTAIPTALPTCSAESPASEAVWRIASTCAGSVAVAKAAATDSTVTASSSLDSVSTAEVSS